MSFFIGRNELQGNNTGVMDLVMNPEALMRAAPDYYGPRFDAIHDLRKADDGTGYKGQEFRRVASFVNVPMFNQAMKLFDPDFMKDKKKFYAFLDRNREYCTYDRRPGGHTTAADNLKLPLSALGLNYPGGPETLDEFEQVIEEIPSITPSTETPVSDKDSL